MLGLLLSLTLFILILLSSVAHADETRLTMFGRCFVPLRVPQALLTACRVSDDLTTVTCRERYLRADGQACTVTMQTSYGGCQSAFTTWQASETCVEVQP
jgi:hypothetical protein